MVIEQGWGALCVFGVSSPCAFSRAAPPVRLSLVGPARPSTVYPRLWAPAERGDPGRCELTGLRSFHVSSFFPLNFPIFAVMICRVLQRQAENGRCHGAENTTHRQKHTRTHTSMYVERERGRSYFGLNRTATQPPFISRKLWSLLLRRNDEGSHGLVVSCPEECGLI